MEQTDKPTLVQTNLQKDRLKLNNFIFNKKIKYYKYFLKIQTKNLLLKNTVYLIMSTLWKPL